ncbi:MAG: PAS domain-containing methyl-accepting chemotaxis protein [Propionivibrio sp.]
MKINLPVTQSEIPFPKGRYIVSRTDLKGIITHVNDTFVEVSGFSREELIGKNHNIVRHPDMLPGAFAWMWDTIKQGRPWHGVVKNRAKSGDHYWVDTLVVPVLKDGAVSGYMSVRSEPTRQQVAGAEDLYQKLKDGRASIPKTPLLQRISLKTKFYGLLSLLIAMQIAGGVAHLFAPALGLSTAGANLLLQTFWVASIMASAALLLTQRQALGIMDRIVGRMQNIIEGRLTDAIPLTREDELGRLNDALVIMQTHLKVMMSEIVEAANLIGDSAGALNAEMEQTRQATEQQSGAVTRIASAVEELVAAVDDIADNAQKAEQAVEASRSLLGQATSSMQDSQAATSNVVTTVDAAGRTMADLSRSIQSIEKITQVIHGIADQTNLLALNAAIEAARAGESGRGFAVVADEVRKLAEQAARQTAEIAASVHDIQRVTRQALSTMESAGEHVTTTDCAVQSARSGLDSVASNGDAVAQIARQIADGTRQQSSAGTEIAGQVEGILGGISQTSSAISEVTERTALMHTAAEQLRSLVAHFRYAR